jgi:lipoic acid synthetase
MIRTLRTIDRTERENYSETLRFQQQLLQAKQQDPSRPDYLVFVEHEPIYTTGRGKELPPLVPGIPRIEAKRGGQSTYHGPGQLVGYTLLDLNQSGRDLHKCLRRIETAIIDTLVEIGLPARSVEGATGAWIGEENPRKIASIGIGVDAWITYHGWALNYDLDLAPLRAINPCGLDASVYTTLKLECERYGRELPSLTALKRDLSRNLAHQFDLELEANGEIRLTDDPRKLPAWLRVQTPGTPSYNRTKDLLQKLKLVTVCEEARCPNHGECWSHRTATFMVMGELCTRRCSFCSVMDGTKENLQPLDTTEPDRVGQAVKTLGLHHIVITSVNRDDLPDMGAAHFDATVRAVKRYQPECRIELLIPDQRGQRPLVESILRSGQVSVLNHNLETVPRLYPTVRPGAKMDRSLNVLKWAKDLHPKILTKSGLMLGLGETRHEVYEVMDALRSVGCDILTLGQYLRPTEKQLPIARFVTPEEFDEYKQAGLERGFRHVESGPLVRSSYHAWQHVEGETPPPYEEPAFIEEPLELLNIGLLRR